MDPLNVDRPLEHQIKEQLEGILEEVPFVRPEGWEEEIRIGGPAGRVIDLAVDVTTGGEQWRLFIEVKGSGEPRIVRGAVQQLQTYLFQQLQTHFFADDKRGYGVVAAPYIGPGGREICQEAGVGYVDLAGNCRLVFDSVFIERRGFVRPKAEQRPLRTLFAPKAGRVLRVLFEEPGLPWQMQALAIEAQVSIGLVSKVKQRLLGLEYAGEDKEGLRLYKPEALLREWAANYRYRSSKTLDCYAPGDPPDVERSLAEYCRANDIRYAFTLFSGAARVAPFARYARGFAYAVYDLQEVIKKLGWKPVASGANFTLLLPFDDGLLYRAREIDEDVVVSDIQLYLDLFQYGGRGEEGATFILEQKLRPRW